MTIDKIMALAKTYAASSGKALLERLYGKSQSYTEQCAAEAFKDREALRAEIEKLVRDAERYRWLKYNCALGIKQNGTGWSLNTQQCVAPEGMHDLDAAIDAAMEKQP